MFQLSHLYTTGKNHSFAYRDLCQHVMSLLFNMLSSFVIAFLPRSRYLLISWLQSPSTVISESKKIKSVPAATFTPSICHEVMGPDAMIFVYWRLSFKPAFSLSSFTLIKRLFSYSSLSAIKEISYAYMRLLILTILIPAYDSLSQTLPMMYSAYKLNNQGDNIQLYHICFPILNQLFFPYPASWHGYRFLRRQERWSVICIS